MNSLTANSVTSNSAMNSSWTGLVLPRTAPNEMSTEPVQKSALIILKQTKFNGNITEVTGTGRGQVAKTIQDTTQSFTLSL